MTAASRVKNRAATAIAVRVQDRSDWSLDAGMAQRSDDQIALPTPIGILVEMLHGAAAADSEMRADRVNALCTRLMDVHEAPAIGVAGHGLDIDDLSGKSRGYVNRSVGRVRYSVAMLAEPIDQNSLNHAGPR